MEPSQPAMQMQPVICALRARVTQRQGLDEVYVAVIGRWLSVKGKELS